MVRTPDILHFLQGISKKNLGLKSLALVLAVVLWWFVAGESKVQVGFAVPLEIRNIPQGMTIMNKVERQVEVRLAGPPSLLGGVQQADVAAAIDLSDARAGKSGSGFPWSLESAGMRRCGGRSKRSRSPHLPSKWMRCRKSSPG
ncbi:MAG: YbbR-like domain-containing protein [Deltaproteobacteria bacterium]|nr:YbbR-like domain-containing protein [Deltaproteobacteria bacterium]